MTKFDEAARRRIAQGWATTPLDQESFAAQHGISPRTLREWVRVYGASDRPVARARAIVDDAIAKLQALRAALDAEEACQVGADDASPEAVSAQPERHAPAAGSLQPAAQPAGPAPATAEPNRHAHPAVKLSLVPPPADPEPAPRPRSRGGFFASMDEP